MKSFQPWPTEENDLMIAEYVIRKHLDLNNADTLPLYTSVKGDKIEVSLKETDWLRELHGRLIETHGTKDAHIIVDRLVSRFIRADHSLH